MKIASVLLAILWAFVVTVEAQQVTSRKNIFGGEDVYLDGKGVYSTRKNVFGGRDLLLPNHHYPPRQPQYRQSFGAGSFSGGAIKSPWFTR